MRWLDSKIDELIRRYRRRDLNPLRIGPQDDPTYYRYFVIPRNRWFNIYLHDFRHDDAENLHDHRMLNISFLLQGSYFEESFSWRPVEGYPLPDTHRTFLPERSIKIRLPVTPHRVILCRDEAGEPIPMWSLFVGFPHCRDWGFWIPNGGRAKWIPYTEVVANTDPTAPGYGLNDWRKHQP